MRWPVSWRGKLLDLQPCDALQIGLRYRFNDKQISDSDVNGSRSDDKKIRQIQDYAYYMPQRSLPDADNELLIPSVNNQQLNDLDVDDWHSDIDKTRQSQIEVEQ
ncbi:hypothetical protein Tco_1484829 [Tanacetum coccineum]